MSAAAIPVILALTTAASTGLQIAQAGTGQGPDKGEAEIAAAKQRRAAAAANRTGRRSTLLVEGSGEPDQGQAPTLLGRLSG